jgi:hypothetical protein
MKRTITIDGININLVCASHDGGPCGILYSCWDTYGEPVTSPSYFSTPEQALDDREQSLRKMFS